MEEYNVFYSFYIEFDIISFMIKLTNLSKYFDKLCAVNNVSFTIEPGDLFALLGPNGAGKSTLFGMISGLMSPSSGQIFINGKDIRKNKESVLNSMGVLFENPTFYNYISGRENIAFIARLKDCYDNKKIDNLLQLVGLSGRADDLVGKYSLGMKQRLALAGALISDPDILLLDEPTNGLDPEGIHIILELLQKLSLDKQKTIIISSHQVFDVESICNKIAILNEGNILCDGKLDELLGDNLHSYLITTDNPDMCKQHLAKVSYIKDYRALPRKKSLKELYLDVIRKSRL